MAILTGPLFSIDARGQVGKSVCYCKLGRTNYAKSYHVPTNPNSIAQQIQRLAVRTITKGWAKALARYTGPPNPFWDDIAEALQTTPYHAYLKTNLQRWKHHLLPTYRPDAGLYCGSPIDAFEVFGSAPNYSFSLEWYDPEAWPFTVQIAASTDEEFTPEKTNTIILTQEITDYYEVYPYFNDAWTAPDSTPRYFKARCGDPLGGPQSWQAPD